MTIDDNLRRKIASHLVTNYHGEGTPTVQQMLRYIPTEVADWKKIKLLDRNEVIRVARLAYDDDGRNFRDNTFVKVSLVAVMTSIHSRLQCIVRSRG